MYFGDNLKFLREQKGLMQKDVAEDLGLFKQTYNRYEQGEREPEFEYLIKISEYFNISIDDLLKRKLRNSI